MALDGYGAMTMLRRIAHRYSASVAGRMASRSDCTGHGTALRSCLIGSPSADRLPPSKALGKVSYEMQPWLRNVSYTSPQVGRHRSSAVVHRRSYSGRFSLMGMGSFIPGIHLGWWLLPF